MKWKLLDAGLGLSGHVHLLRAREREPRVRRTGQLVVERGADSPALDLLYKDYVELSIKKKHLHNVSIVGVLFQI